MAKGGGVLGDVPRFGLCRSRRQISTVNAACWGSAGPALKTNVWLEAFAPICTLHSSRGVLGTAHSGGSFS
jgi:hypothetical protein